MIAMRRIGELREPAGHRRLADRDRGQRLPRAAAPLHPRAAAGGRRGAARRARQRGRGRGARRAARLGLDRVGAPARASARRGHAAPLSTASSYAAIAEICDVPVGDRTPSAERSPSATRR